MPLVGIGTPPTRRLVCPLPPVSGGRGTLTGEKGVGRVPIPTRGIHCGTLYMYVLCGPISLLTKNGFHPSNRRSLLSESPHWRKGERGKQQECFCQILPSQQESTPRHDFSGDGYVRYTVSHTASPHTPASIN